jgi:hypothetical protein
MALASFDVRHVADVNHAPLCTVATMLTPEFPIGI